MGLVFLTLAPTVHASDKWSELISALEFVESGNRINAIGKRNDTGVLQLTPVYVREVNRILEKKVYKLSDRLSERKSIEMFNIYQAKHNACRNILRAIRLHNPKAPMQYRLKILKAIENNEKSMALSRVFILPRVYYLCCTSYNSSLCSSDHLFWNAGSPKGERCFKTYLVR